MPTETNRKIAKKLVRISGVSVPVPVIAEITFQDPVDHGQETTYTIDNSAKADRDVHVDQVQSSSSGASLNVERIDLWRVLDPVDRNQETFVAFDNKTIGSSPPPYFITHLKTHIVKYRSDPNDPHSSTISAELIDEFSVLDPVDRAQEMQYTLLNPIDDDAANAQITDDTPDITDSQSGIDPPYRTDPFQNIVDFSGQPQVFGNIWIYVGTWGDYWSSLPPHTTNPDTSNWIGKNGNTPPDWWDPNFPTQLDFFSFTDAPSWNTKLFPVPNNFPSILIFVDINWPFQSLGDPVYLSVPADYDQIDFYHSKYGSGPSQPL
jgi:hypothetical protein